MTFGITWVKFSDFSWIQDFEATESQNTDLGRF